MIETILYKNSFYPAFQGEGYAAKFAIPYALSVCKGSGYDIGCGRLDWSLPGAIPIDPVIDEEWHANKLPLSKVDYIFSSHCLEHIPDWVTTMDYWRDHLNPNGVLFLYLPDFSQEYWRPWNNRKHLHVFTPDIIRSYMHSRGYQKVFVSGVDLNNSFMAMGEK